MLTKTRMSREDYEAFKTYLELIEFTERSKDALLRAIEIIEEEDND